MMPKCLASIWCESASQRWKLIMFVPRRDIGRSWIQATSWASIMWCQRWLGDHISGWGGLLVTQRDSDRIIERRWVYWYLFITARLRRDGWEGEGLTRGPACYNVEILSWGERSPKRGPAGSPALVRRANLERAGSFCPRLPASILGAGQTL